MSKLKINVERYGVVEVYRLKGVKKSDFDFVVTDAVNNTVRLINERHPGYFHPVMGVGGYDWDHENQKPYERDVIPEVEIIPSRIEKVWQNVKDFFSGMRSYFH